MKTLKELNFITLCCLYLFNLSLFTFLYINEYVNVSNAQSSFMATLIGGTTNGSTDICCNGIILDFDSQDQTNLYILDGEALFMPIFSRSYVEGNEQSSGYNVLGNLVPGLCLDVEAECESATQIPVIKSIGTSGLGGF